MFSFKAAFFASLLSVAAASEDFYHTYEPQTSVTDHGAISFDQASLESLVGFPDDASFAAAKLVYAEGGNSKSFAEITLRNPLTVSVSKGTRISGLDSEGEPISGTAFANYESGDTVIRIQYATGDVQSAHVKCRVGGLPADEQEQFGCFAETGANQADPTVTIEGFATPLPYTYDIETNNDNGRTIQGFSTSANTRFRPGDDLNADYFAIFLEFVTYYGSYDFADRIVNAGLDGTATSLSRGNIDLAGYGFDARGQIAKKGTAYINILLYVLRELYDAIFDCQENCPLTACNDDAVHALDEAVAFYVGNSHSADEAGIGNLAFGLAEKRCKNFATCSGADPLLGTSNVNVALFEEFEQMKDNLNEGACQTAEAQVPVMARYFWIPLIQGTLRYAWITDTNNSPSEAAQAEGAIFAAAVLPVVHTCSPEAATTIYNNMRLNNGASKADFNAVKTAFESTYSCLDITCADVGGLIDDTTGDYYPGARPCGGVDAFQSSASMIALSGSVLAAFVFSMM